MDDQGIRHAIYKTKAMVKTALARKNTMTATDTGARLEAIKKYAQKGTVGKVAKRSEAGATKGLSNFRSDQNDIEKMIRGGS